MSQSEILLTADVHCFQHKKSSERLYDCLDALKWVLQTAIDNEVPRVAILGDLFHHRYQLHVPTYQLTYEVLREYAAGKGLEVWLLVGNHDMWFHDRWDVSSIIPFGSIPNVTVVNKPSTLDVGGYPVSFLPYTANPGEDLKSIVNDAKFRLLMGHVAVDGAVYNTRAQTYSDVYVEQDGDMVKVTEGVFHGWNKVFLGHYHTPQVMNPVVEYVGSPLELCFSDVGQQKHVVIYDFATRAQRYVVNSFSPRHVISTKSELHKYDLNNAFLALVPEDMSSPEVLETYRELMEKFNLRDFETAPVQKATKEEEQFVETTHSIRGNEQQVTEQYLEWAEKQGRLEGLKIEKLKRLAAEALRAVSEMPA